MAWAAFTCQSFCSQGNDLSLNYLQHNCMWHHKANEISKKQGASLTFLQCCDAQQCVSVAGLSLALIATSEHSTRPDQASVPGRLRGGWGTATSLMGTPGRGGGMVQGLQHRCIWGSVFCPQQQCWWHGLKQGHPSHHVQRVHVSHTHGTCRAEPIWSVPWVTLHPPGPWSVSHLGQFVTFTLCPNNELGHSSIQSTLSHGEWGKSGWEQCNSEHKENPKDVYSN